jgi:phospholipid transport system substrate-binding protein
MTALTRASRRIRAVASNALLLLLGLLLAATVGPAQAQGQSQGAEERIRTMLEERDEQIKAILRGAEGGGYTQQQRDELKTLINGVIDFRAMGRQALGSHWGDLSEAQREEFVAVFQDVVRAQSMSDLGVYNSKVTFDAVVVENDSAYVRTTTEYQGTRTPVEYDLARVDDAWLAEDIIVDGVSTAQGYARSFQTVVRKRGFETLMKSLRKKRDQVQS